jgi:hypothetical protein
MKEAPRRTFIVCTSNKGGRRMKRGGFWMVVPAVAAVVLALVAARSAAHDGREEGHGFSNRTVKGDWGFNTSFGMLVPPAVPPGRADDGGGGESTSTATATAR